MNVGSTGCFDQKQQQPFLRVRREPFEYGLLPLPTLIFPDPHTALRELRNKLCLEDIINTDGDARIDCAGIALALDLPEDEAQLVLETLTSVLPDPLCATYPRSSGSCSAGTPTVSFDELVVFLYIQNYKKPLIRPHKDAASVADVWPSTSAFDGFLPTLSPLQVSELLLSFNSMHGAIGCDRHHMAHS